MATRTMVSIWEDEFNWMQEKISAQEEAISEMNAVIARQRELLCYINGVCKHAGFDLGVNLDEKLKF